MEPLFYRRVSRDEQRAVSAQSQVEQLEIYAQRLGLEYNIGQHLYQEKWAERPKLDQRNNKGYQEEGAEPPIISVNRLFRDRDRVEKARNTFERAADYIEGEIRNRFGEKQSE